MFNYDGVEEDNDVLDWVGVSGLGVVSVLCVKVQYEYI